MKARVQCTSVGLGNRSSNSFILNNYDEPFTPTELLIGLHLLKSIIILYLRTCHIPLVFSSPQNQVTFVEKTPRNGFELFDTSCSPNVVYDIRGSELAEIQLLGKSLLRYFVDP